MSLKSKLLQSARDALNKTQATLDLQKVDYQRTHTLMEHGILPQQEDDNAKLLISRLDELVARVSNKNRQNSEARIPGTDSSISPF